MHREERHERPDLRARRGEREAHGAAHERADDGADREEPGHGVGAREPALGGRAEILEDAPCKTNAGSANENLGGDECKSSTGHRFSEARLSSEPLLVVVVGGVPLLTLPSVAVAVAVASPAGGTATVRAGGAEAMLRR